ncbi:pre-16S rRNA-processing nuclease YqgF [bacterium]|nr:MAG: pre-16S rRNA-processing nuclease YqgF [bacterium]
MRVLGVDPGTRKVGLAVVDESGLPLALEVAPVEATASRAVELVRSYGAEVVALGGLTGHRTVEEVLRAVLPVELPLHLVDERRSSYDARALYWHLHPPRGLRRLVPRGMLFPPEPLDAYAAAVIACRFLDQRSRGAGRLNRLFVL